MTLEHYILNGKEIVPATLMEWANWFETADRHVAQEEVGPYMVSTIFLGLDHRFFGDGPPLLFETMVFGHKDDGEVDWSDKECHRYSTWDDAEAGHKAIVKRLWLKVNKERLTERAATAAD
jgi:hypothetical protein